MEIINTLSRPDKKKTTFVKDGINSDIRRVLESQFKKAVKEAAPIAPQFKGADRLATARNIYDYLRTVIEYQKDEPPYQDIRLPRYFHYSKIGDCKSFSLNALAIYANIYPQDALYFRYTGYLPGVTVPSHVYAIIKPANQAEIIIDGCWYYFNSEKNYTFITQSKDMQIRVLSGIERDNIVRNAVPGSSTGLDYEAFNASLSPSDRQRLQKVVQAKAEADFLHEAAMHGMDAEYVHSCLCDIQDSLGETKSERRKRRAKKALHWFNVAALFLGRGAFILFVTLNVNGLASKLQKLIDWGKFGNVENVWYQLGGNVKKFKKIINRGSKKKKLWLSKRAHARYNEKFEGKRDEHGNKINDALNDSIGVAPAIAAAALAAIPVLAALIPKMIQAFKTAPDGKGQADAGEMVNQGQDLVQSVKEQGYKPNAETIDTFLPPGQSADLAPAAPAAPGGGGFDVSNFGFKPQEEVEGLGDFASVMSDLTPALSNLATVGMTELGKVVSRSKNKNLRAIGDGVNTMGSEGFAAYAAQRAGYNDAARYLRPAPPKRAAISPVMLLAAAGAAYVVLKK